MKYLNLIIIFLTPLILLSCGNSVQPISFYHPNKGDDDTYKYFVSFSDAKSGKEIVLKNLITDDNLLFKLDAPIILGTEVKKDFVLRIALPYSPHASQNNHGVLKRNGFEIKNASLKAVTHELEKERTIFTFKLSNFNLLLNGKIEDSLNFNFDLIKNNSQVISTNFAITTAPSNIKIEHFPPFKISDSDTMEIPSIDYINKDGESYQLIDVIKITNLSTYPIHIKSNINLDGTLLSTTLLYGLNYDTISKYACNVFQTVDRNESVLTRNFLIVPGNQNKQNRNNLFNQDTYKISISPKNHHYYFIYSKNFNLEDYIQENYPLSVPNLKTLEVTCSNKCELPIVNESHPIPEDNPHVDLATVIPSEIDFDDPEIGPACVTSTPYPKIERYHHKSLIIEKGPTDMECFKGRVLGTMIKTFKEGIEDLPVTLRIGPDERVFKASFDKEKINQMGRDFKIIPNQISITN